MMKRWRTLPVFLAVIVLGSLLFGRYAPPASADLGESAFASVVEPTGVAATPGRLLVTRPFCVTHASTQPRQVLSINNNGVVSVFATLPQRVGCFEEYLAIAGPADQTQPGFPSPTKGGFTSNSVYVTQGQRIIQISHTGVVSPAPFATVAACTGSHTGIVFDHVGTFGWNMIIACNNGTVWKVTKTGIVSMIADVGAAVGLPGALNLGNPDVAPASFTACPGCILVPAENTGQVYGVSSAGVVTTLAPWPSAEGVNVVPTSKCDFGTSGGTYFTTNFVNGPTPSAIYRFPISAFSGHGGKAIVTSEFGGGMGLLAPSGGITLFHGDAWQHEGSTFVDCTVPLLLGIIVKPGSVPHTINPRSNGKVPVAILSTATFNALTQTIISSIRIGVTGTEDSVAFCNHSGEDVNGDGFLDLMCHAYTQKLGITTPSVYRGPLIVKLRFNAPGGDPEGEGSN